LGLTSGPAVQVSLAQPTKTSVIPTIRAYRMNALPMTKREHNRFSRRRPEKKR
jgi:hypothetical protein